MRTLFAVLALTLGCRPDPGEPFYPDPTGSWDTGPDTGDAFLPGDDPWDGVSPRLFFSLFYEGGGTQVLQVDDSSIHYYIYEGSYSQQPLADCVEGTIADRITVTSSTWWGGGIHLDGQGAEDLTGWTTLHVALKSEDPALEAFEIGMVGSRGEGLARATDYGFVADGEWHVLNIPLADIAESVGMDSVTVPLLLLAPTAEAGTSLLVDDMYLTAEDS